MAYYQCFKTLDRTVYCSSQTFKGHDPAAIWVRDCMAHFQIIALNLLGKPFERDEQPDGAVIWP
jgi:hypothetical protein